MEIEIGKGKSGRRAYGFDDIAIVPSRRTRDPEDVDISWEIDAYKFELPLIASAMDGVVSPRTAIEVGNLGGLACLNLEGLWTRYEDPDPLFEEIAELEPEKATRRMQEIYDEPADTFVASFVGSPPMNLIRHRDYILGFRPENFLPDGIHNTGTKIAPFPFRVTRIEYLGADRLLYGILTDRFADQKVIATLPSTITVKIEPAKTYDFSVKESDLNFFSASTELRIIARSL